MYLRQFQIRIDVDTPTETPGTKPALKRRQAPAVVSWFLDNLLVCLFGGLGAFLIINHLVAGRYGEAIKVAALFGVIAVIVFTLHTIDKRQRQRISTLLAETNQALQNAGYVLSPQPFVTQTVYKVGDGLVRVVPTRYSVQVQPSTVEAQVLAKQALWTDNQPPRPRGATLLVLDPPRNL